MTFRLLGMTDEERLAFEEASGIKTEGARLIVEESVRQAQELLDRSVREVQGVIGPHGSVARLQAGGVNISQTGLSVYESGVLKTTIEHDGDFLAGSDITEASTTSFCVFVNEQIYNNESMGSGDILIGDNSTGQSNVKFDASEGQLQFRFGTTVNVYMDTDGSIRAGGGAVVINSVGITLLAGAFPATSYLLWKLSDGTLVGNIDGWEYVAGSESGMEIVGQAKNSSFNGTVFLIANDHGGNNETSLKVQEDNVTAVIGITTPGAANTRAFNVQSLVSATNALNTVLYLLTKSSGTVANGLGTAIEFMIEDSAGNSDTAGYIGVDWTDKTNGSEDAELKIGLMKAGTQVVALTLDPTAGLTINGSSIVAAENNTDDIYRVDSPGGSSAFVGTIATLPGGATLTYNVTSGTEGAMVPTATTQLGKMRLYNTTRGTSALISNCVTGTNTLTLTASVPAGWVVGDTISIASQTVSGGGVSWVDIEITSGPTNRKSLFVRLHIASATAGDTTWLHPLETYNISKTSQLDAQVANALITSRFTDILKITSNVFSLTWTGTPSKVIVREAGYLQ